MHDKLSPYVIVKSLFLNDILNRAVDKSHDSHFRLSVTGSKAIAKKFVLTIKFFTIIIAAENI
jgi:hypothetical protein